MTNNAQILEYVLLQKGKTKRGNFSSQELEQVIGDLYGICGLFT